MYKVWVPDTCPIERAIFGGPDVHIYDSQIVHPTPQCFKSFHPVYFVNEC